jgi:hypothetical protein
MHSEVEILKLRMRRASAIGAPEKAAEDFAELPFSKRADAIIQLLIAAAGSESRWQQARPTSVIVFRASRGRVVQKGQFVPSPRVFANRTRSFPRWHPHCSTTERVEQESHR